MAEQKKAEEFIRVNHPWFVEYRKAAGEYGGRYLTHLRQKGKLLAVQCPNPNCQRWLLPPYIVCSTCHTKIPKYPQGWVELSGKGSLVYWDKMVTPQMNILSEMTRWPYLTGLIQLDEGPLFSYFIGVLPDSEEEGKLKKGLRVELEMKPWWERLTSPSEDIKYFKVLWDEPIKELK